MSLSSVLPKPVQNFSSTLKPKEVNSQQSKIAKVGPQPYGHRHGFIPRIQEDFADGGAFPEIQAAQFPLDMGRTKNIVPSKKVIPLQVDKTGKVRFDAIAKQGHHKDKIVKSTYEDLLPKPIDEEDEKFQIPKEDAIRETTEKTRAALEKLVSGKIAAAMPVKTADKRAPVEYIRYTPAQQNTAYASGAKQRIIRMVEAPRDPMSPPRFNINKKIPRGEPSPPAPVLHSPNRKLTVKEQQDWKIPPCISNWKNPKGYTIPLDKRLAADGRGLQEVTINENFAKLAEALYIADRKAREAVEMRAQMERKLAQKEKEKKEEHLRLLAQRAREARAGIKQTIVEHLGAGAANVENPSGHQPFMQKGATASNNKSRVAPKDTQEDSEYLEREQIRQERHRERVRERNLARMGKEAKQERERDISEKIALGLPNPNQNTQGIVPESQFDARLFNQSMGMDSGFKDDEAYDVYDKPWRDGAVIGQSIYRPSKSIGIDGEFEGENAIETLIKTNRFVPDRGFQGTATAAMKNAIDEAANVRQHGPIQFERDGFTSIQASKTTTVVQQPQGAGKTKAANTNASAATEDPFNLDKFLGSVKKGSSSNVPISSQGGTQGEKSSKKREREDVAFGRHGDRNAKKR